MLMSNIVTVKTMLMPRRTLGGTGLKVSVLGFGASPLGGVFHPVDEESCTRAVHAAFHAGVNFFDTSPFYGATKSEMMLGKALAGLPRSEIIISTKVGRYGQDHFDFSAERVSASVEESLGRLQTNYIDLIQCHDIEFGDLDQVINETLPALIKLREKGVVRHIGITGLPFSAFHYVLDRCPLGTVDVILSYCHNCLNDDSLVMELPYFEEKHVGVINASPLAMGLLTKQGPPDWHPAPLALKEAAKAAALKAEECGVDIAKIALAEAIKTPGIATTLVGMATFEVVTANVTTTLQAFGLVPNDVQSQEETAALEVRDALKGVMGMTWPSGR
ncbi:hypothetical protein CEUSTIGMA_g11892.t1 [Chlamydomonas eustigma]|uniref:NADP-dependent oxidoreductase domain-containing protein n=1 Tax=Chlamydomonas eustigma TaxID=1157962 RepID=A0A250XNI1_9CHLO|nr:hypothetical protein CEUSTIGMA_g11892.t1 [Chlamydomonas eustigma]|eukprot:GAX84472.1 hypothetical protein CEUSTIGMA_g11892.t1 [Chlamydomonas eustigma]